MPCTININRELNLGTKYQGVHYDLSEGAQYVRAAGNIQFRNGIIVSLDNASGHYRRGNNSGHIDAVLNLFDQNEIIPIETLVNDNDAINFPGYKANYYEQFSSNYSIKK